MFGIVFKLATKVQDATATMAAHKNSFTGYAPYTHTITHTNCRHNDRQTDRQTIYKYTYF